MGKIKRIFLAILLLLVTCNAWAATYYVKTGGNDSAAGTSDGTAWAHCPGMDGWTGSATLVSGDTVYFREGDTWTSSSVPVLATQAGVTYRGLGYGAAGTRAILQSSGVVVDDFAADDGVIQINASNVSIYSFDLDANNQVIHGLNIGYGATGDITGTTVDDCIIHDVGYDDINDLPSVSVTVSNDATYTYFTKAADSTDWTKLVTTNYLSGASGTIKWSGFTSSALNNTEFQVRAVTANQIKVDLISGGYTDTNTVTGEARWIHYVYGLLVGSVHHKNENVTITNTEVYNTSHEGLAIYPSRSNDCFVGDITVRGCYVHDTGLANSTWGHSLFINDTVDGLVVEYSTFENGYAVSITSYDEIVPPTNVTLKYNLFINQQAGLNVSGKPTTAQHSVVDIYGNILNETRLYMSGNLQYSTVNIYNNTIYNTIENMKGIWLYKTSSNVSGISIKNNIIQTGSGTAAICLDDEGALLSSSQHTNNLYYRASGNLILFGKGNFYTSANIQANYEATAQVTSPSFTGGTLPTCFSDATGVCGTGTYGVDLRPNTTYFAITSGDALGAGAVLSSDYNKAINNAGTDSTYTRGSAWDIGAYEYTLDGGATIVNTGAVMSGCSF